MDYTQIYQPEHEREAPVSTKKVRKRRRKQITFPLVIDQEGQIITDDNDEATETGTAMGARNNSTEDVPPHHADSRHARAHREIAKANKSHHYYNSEMNSSKQMASPGDSRNRVIKVDRTTSRNTKALQTPVLDGKQSEMNSRKHSKATSSQYSAFKKADTNQNTPHATNEKLPDIHQKQKSRTELTKKTTKTGPTQQAVTVRDEQPASRNQTKSEVHHRTQS